MWKPLKIDNQLVYLQEIVKEDGNKVTFNMSNGIDLDVNLVSTKDISLCYTKDIVNANFIRLRLNKHSNLYAIETAYKLS